MNIRVSSIQCKASLYWSFECFTSTLSCQMDPNGTSSPFRAAKCKAVQPLMGSRWAQLALRFRSSRSSWTWPSALQIRKIMRKKPGETFGGGLETSEACGFKTHFISSVYFQECIILRVNHLTKKWTVKESFRSRRKKNTINDRYCSTFYCLRTTWNVVVGFRGKIQRLARIFMVP